MPISQKAHTAVYSIILNDNKVLLMKRQNTGFRDGFFSLPGGKIDDLELPSTAMLRELKEEVNLSVNSNDLEFLLTQHRISLGYPCVDFYFIINNYNIEELNINEPEKCAALEWFDLNNLPEKTLHYIKNALDSLNTKKSFIEDNNSTELDDKKAL